jgi:response regulator RpfG family c-di-GMP phosphodiesterase
VERTPYDLLLLDLHMPGLDGFEVVQSIRARERLTGGHLHVIAVTARSRLEDRRRCLAAGMDDFIAKPISASALWAALAQIVPVAPARDLLSPRVLLAACGGDPRILESICRALQARLPADLAEIAQALVDQEAPRLREAAHKLSAMGGAFSATFGQIASDLEDRAARGALAECVPLADQLREMGPRLLRRITRLSLESLERQAARDEGSDLRPGEDPR